MVSTSNKSSQRQPSHQVQPESVNLPKSSQRLSTFPGPASTCQPSQVQPAPVNLPRSSQHLSTFPGPASACQPSQVQPAPVNLPRSSQRLSTFPGPASACQPSQVQPAPVNLPRLYTCNYLLGIMFWALEVWFQIGEAFECKLFY